VIDPFDRKYVDCLSDIIRWSLLSRVSDGMPSLSAGKLKMPLEQPRLVLPFSAVQADGQDVVPAGSQLVQHLQRLVRRAIALAPCDNAARHSEIVEGFSERAR
jgi:hypothetical protein